jgi:D-sedoheptulose 7-phosphate isomerase
MDFFENYFHLIDENLKNVNIDELKRASAMCKLIGKKNKKIMIAGNGGSAAMSSHVAVDFTKVGKIRTVNFNEADLLTCFANDYGYERVFEKCLEYYSDPGDLFIAISSSGQSKNMLNAVKFAKNNSLNVITFSGFKEDNPLKQLGDMNFWVDSSGYNIVEMVHHTWLLSIVDHIVGKVEYSAS